MVTDYTIAFDTTIKQHGDQSDIEYALPGQTHFFLTDAKSHRILWTNKGTLMGVSNEQMLPIKRELSK